MLAVEQNKILMPSSYSRYVAWGFADHSLRIGNYDSDKVSLVCEEPFGEIVCCTCPSSKLIVTAGTSTVRLSPTFQSRADFKNGFLQGGDDMGIEQKILVHQTMLVRSHGRRDLSRLESGLQRDRFGIEGSNGHRLGFISDDIREAAHRALRSPGRRRHQRSNRNFMFHSQR